VRLDEFIHANAPAIMQAWEQEARQVPPAQALAHPALVDHLPRLLNDIAELIRTYDERPSLTQAANAHADDHAWERIEQGFSLDHLVSELALLRSCILRLWRNVDPNVSVDDAELLTRVVDRAIQRSVLRYFEMRSRLLEGLEQIADAAFVVDQVDEFLDRVLRIFMRFAPSIDSAAILLCEGASIRARAAVGLEEEVRQGVNMRIGEGFAGTVAATRRPLLLRRAWQDPLVRSQIIRERKTCALYGVPLLDRDRVVGVAHIGSCVSEDIPEPEKRLFAALAQRATSAIIKQQLREELRRAVDELKLAAEFRERFVGIVSHDLRNPLSSIALTAGILLRSPDLPPHLATQARRILTNAEHMTRMISDLLDFTRGRLGGGIPLTPAAADLAQILDRVVDEYEQTHPTRQIECTVRGDTRGIWDAERIAQVISNLLGNALQYGDRSQPVHIKVVGTADQALLSVHNSGTPIPANLLPHIFNPFKRAAERQVASSGLGLGLFIANEVARAHGGRIDVESNDIGTTFTVRLPRKVSPRPVP
jgi:signal transduction histidine kinase